MDLVGFHEATPEQRDKSTVTLSDDEEEQEQLLGKPNIFRVDIG